MTTENTTDSQERRADPQDRVQALVMRSTVDQAADYLRDYWVTYKDQPNYETYEQKTVVEDMLYGIAVALNPDYRFASGFEKFKQHLRAYLDA